MCPACLTCHTDICYTGGTLQKTMLIAFHGRPTSRMPMKKHQAGFTLVELIMTMVIVGILAVFAAPRFFGADIFKSRGFADQIQASLRYAQKIAIAQRRNVCVTIAGNSLSLATGATAACCTPLSSLSGGGGYVG